MELKSWTCIGLLASPLLLTVPAQAITLGQVDDFQDGTAQGWGSWGAINNVPTGGPTGVGDRYLMVTSTGTSPALEPSIGTAAARWSSDAGVAGVTAISMDLLNLGTVELEMRILLNNNYGTWTSTVPFVVPPDGQWCHVVFRLTTDNLTSVGTGTGTLSDVLAHMNGFGIRHQSGPPMGTWDHTPLASSLGVDNIRVVPEPLSILCYVTGGLMLNKRTSGRTKIGESQLGRRV